MKLTPPMKTDQRQVNLVKKTRNYDIAARSMVKNLRGELMDSSCL
jgi:ribosome recycling factor